MTPRRGTHLLLYSPTSPYRKIDIDIYDEDVLQETELYDAGPRDPLQVLEEARQKQVAVQTLLNKRVLERLLLQSN